MQTDCSCPAQFAVDLFGGKWKTTILYQIATAEEPLRFNALRRRIPKITQKMLTQQLRQLERDGLVNRTYHPTIPPKVEYNLTEMGQSFREPVTTLGYWALENLTKIDTARENYDSNIDT